MTDRQSTLTKASVNHGGRLHQALVSKRIEALMSHASNVTDWDDAYRRKGAEGVSWYEPEPVMSLDLIRLLDVQQTDPVIDIGGGASLLVNRLARSGYSDLTVLDVSEVALKLCRRRLDGGQHVTFIRQDVLAWRPTRGFGLWHDRAVFHFLTDERDKTRYLATMAEALRPDGSVVVATFAEDGPEYCSGLPVARYKPEDLAALLGSDFTVIATRKESHSTPGGITQPFSWVAAKSNTSGVQEKRRVKANPTRCLEPLP
jgi:SAM-dependent methyltransferase